MAEGKVCPPQNLRDVATITKNRLRPGVLFRSASPGKTREHGALFLLHKLCVKTIVDLRPPTESKQDISHKEISKVYKAHFPCGSKSRASEPGCYFYQLPLFSRISLAPHTFELSRTFFSMVGKKMTLRNSAAQHDALTIFHRKNITLFDLNKHVLEKFGDRVCKTLKLIANPSRHPVLIHCAHGKDRTGLIAALVLSVAGATDEEIVADYVLSQTSGGSDLAMADFEGLPAHVARHWADVPEATMRETLSFLRTQYSSISRYLLGIGFGYTWQAALKHAFDRTRTALTRTQFEQLLAGEAAAVDEVEEDLAWAESDRDACGDGEAHIDENNDEDEDLGVEVVETVPAVVPCVDRVTSSLERRATACMAESVEEIAVCVGDECEDTTDESNVVLAVCEGAAVATAAEESEAGPDPHHASVCHRTDSGMMSQPASASNTTCLPLLDCGAPSLCPIPDATSPAPDPNPDAFLSFV
eukprot:m.237013 g.237013  ORF g.237013 m.237013 type:complete len:473 (+) comp20898_c0_seq1:47-1465(+)